MWEWIVFATIMAIGQFSPGPDMILLTRTALAQGRSAGSWTAIGIASGLSFHALIAVAGVASLMSKGGWLEQTMKWSAAAYLTWLSIQLIRSGLWAKGVKLSEAADEPERSKFENWKRGLFCNLLNPKAAVFLAGVTAPFLVNQHDWQWSAILWATIVFEGALLWYLWVWLMQLAFFKKGYLRVAHWFDLIFGLAMLAAASALLIQA